MCPSEAVSLYCLVLLTVHKGLIFHLSLLETATRRGSLLLRKGTVETDVSLLLPEDTQFKTKELVQLYLKPQCTVRQVETSTAVWLNALTAPGLLLYALR